MATDWKTIVNIPRFTPLANLALSMREVREGLYQVGEDSYLTAGELDEKFEQSTCGRRAMSVIWGMSVSAAVRLSQKDVNVNVDLVALTPPVELSPFGEVENITYSSIADACKRRQVGRIENEIFNRDVQFVYRNVRIARTEYAFLHYEVKPDDVPFAIRRILPDP